MAGPGGQEVGRVSVRVVPDTDGFRRRLQQSLTAETRGIEVDIDVELRDGAVRDLARQTEAAAKAAQAAAGDIEIELDLESRKLMGELAMISRAAEAALSNIDSSIDLDQGEFLAGVEAMADFAEQLLHRIEAGFDVEKSGFLAKVQALAAAAEAAVEAIDVEMTPQATEFITAVQATAQIAEAAAGNIEVALRLRDEGIVTDTLVAIAAAQAAAKANDIDVDIDIDRGSIDRLEGAADRASRSLRQRLSSAASGAGSVLRDLAGAISLSSHSMLILAAVAVFLAPALALISGALISLPAALMAIAIPAGAVYLGWDGMKKAASSLTDEVESLKRVMNQKTQDVFTPIFERLPPLFATFEQKLPGVTNALGTMANGLVATVTSQEGMARIGSIIDNIAKALAQATPGVQSFTDGLLTLLDKSTAKLPGLSNLVNEWGQRFLDWVDRITTAGDDGTVPLEKALSGVRDILSGIVHLLGGLAGTGFDFLAQDDIGSKMKTFFEDFETFISETGPAFLRVFEAAAKVVNWLAAAADKFNAAWNALEWINPFEKFEKMGLVSNQENIFPELSALGILESAIRSLDDAFGGQLGSVIQTLRAQWIAALGDMFSSIGDWFTETLPNTISEWWSGIDWSTYLPDIDWSSVLGGGGLNTFLSSFTPDFSGVTTGFSDAVSQLPGIAAGALSMVLAVIATAAAGMVSSMVSGGGELVAEVASWPGRIIAVLGSLGGLLLGVGADIVQGLINGLRSKLGELAAAAGEIASTVKGAVTGLLGIRSPSTVMHGYGENVNQGLVNGMNAGKGDIQRTAEELAKGLRSGFGDNPNIQIKIVINSGDLSQIDKAASSVDNLGKSAKETHTALTSVEQALKDIDASIALPTKTISLQAKELTLEAKKLDQLAAKEPNKARQADLERQAKMLRARADELSMQKEQLGLEAEIAKYEVENGRFDSLVDDVMAASNQVENQGQNMMERLQRAVANGTAGIAGEFRKMVNDIGRVFGHEDIVGKWDEIDKKTRFSKIPEDFASANRQQFVSDLGLSGKGAVSQLFEQGAKYVIQVNSVDQALEYKQRQQNKDKLSYTRR